MSDSEEFDDPTQGFGPYKVINCGVNSQVYALSIFEFGLIHLG